MRYYICGEIGVGRKDHAQMIIEQKIGKSKVVEENYVTLEMIRKLVSHLLLIK